AATAEAVAELLGQVLDLTRRDELPAQEPRAPGAVYVRRPAEVEDDGHRRRSLAALVGGFDFLPESAPLVERHPTVVVDNVETGGDRRVESRGEVVHGVEARDVRVAGKQAAGDP